MTTRYRFEDAMTKNLLTAAFALLALSACSTSAQLVRKDAVGGRVELQGAYMPAMAEARALMVDHCYGRYDMLELGDAVEFRCRHAHNPKPETQVVASCETGKAGL
jgi:hypothetical protein